ncbi:hypothetical protein PSTT_16166, partial [Puccinia striiformis]
FHTVDALRGKIEDFDLLEKTPFNYGLFEKKATGYHKTIPQVLPSPIATNQTVKNTTGIGHLNQEDFFWRIRSYLDAQGRCHYCKKSCGNAPGTCQVLSIVARSMSHHHSSPHKTGELCSTPAEIRFATCCRQGRPPASWETFQQVFILGSLGGARRAK